MNYNAHCRGRGCGETEMFGGVDPLNESEWTYLSHDLQFERKSVMGQSVLKVKGFCPNCEAPEEYEEATDRDRQMPLTTEGL